METFALIPLKYILNYRTIYYYRIAFAEKIVKCFCAPGEFQKQMNYN